VLGSLGLEQPRGNIVAPGEEGAVPHNAGSAGRVLRFGESLVVDLYPKGQLFADCTRTFCVGPPSEALAGAHRHVLAALEWSHQHTAVGCTAWELQEGVCRLFSEQGYATPLTDPTTEVGYVHSLGHGVGYDLHEEPFFRKANDGGQIELGDVITLEPGLYDQKIGYGLRLEDLVAVEESGPRNLTPLPYDLDPFAWH
jgi:Xaa-Pro aminopeptidase